KRHQLLRFGARLRRSAARRSHAFGRTVRRRSRARVRRRSLARRKPLPSNPGRMDKRVPPFPHKPLGLLGWLLIGLAICAIPLGALFAQTPAPNYTVVETGQGFGRLQQAVDAIGEGRGTIAVAPGRHADCAVQTAGYVAYLAAE